MNCNFQKRHVKLNFYNSYFANPLAPFFFKSMKEVGIEPRNFLICFIFLFKICQELPSFLGLFKQGYKTLTLKSFTKLFKPEFSEDGSNARKFEGEVYALLLKYMREAASMYNKYFKSFLYYFATFYGTSTK